MNEQILEHRLALMVNTVADYAIFLLDSPGAIQSWNLAAEAMKGYPESEAVGQNFRVLYTEEDQRRNHPEHSLNEVTEHGNFQEAAWRKRKDGSLFWALVEVIAIRSDSGELEGFCKVTSDLTDMKQLQEDLVAKERPR